MKTIVAQLLATAALGGHALAQQTAITEDATGPIATAIFGTGSVPAFLEPYDVDVNGRISAEENQAYRIDARRHRLSGRSFDTNSDGVLSPEEKETARERIRTLIEERRIARFRDEDANDDDQLSFAEFSGIDAVSRLDPALAQALFDRLDLDDNNLLSIVEFLVHLEQVHPTRPAATAPNSPASVLPRNDTPVPAPSSESPTPPLRGPASRLSTGN